MFDYEKILYDSILVNDVSNHSFKHKYLWVKKATGLGVTEFFLRLMVWLCLRNDDYKNSQMCFVTGPNIDIASKLIKRMKALFEPKLHITFDSKETVLELNGCSIEAYPSNHMDILFKRFLSVCVVIFSKWIYSSACVIFVVCFNHL